jgi:hypothetical protein
LSIWLGWLLLFPPALLANPANKKSLETWLGPSLKRPVSCVVCHQADPHGTKPSLDEVDKPHNVFGQRLVALRKSLAKQGKPTDLDSRLSALSGKDADGDGFSNLQELLVGTLPGDAASKPTADEAKGLPARLQEFAKYQSRYRWRPFDPVTRPSVPEGNLQPIDASLAVERAERKLATRPPANRETLVRRLYLDLTGLPPTLAERDAFLKDTSADAYEKLVDQLLASPRHAEHWGRHWMDIWRYSDWAGYGNEIRESQPHIWRWRDWIVESIDRDKPYDQMIREMLAGDELAPEDDQTIRATGFLVRNWYKFNRNVWLDNTVEHTSKAFLGLTINCARCHDHMYDPIKQTDYYSFRAFFEPLQIRIDRVPGQADTAKDGLARVYDADLNSITYLLMRGNEASPDKDRPCPPTAPGSVRGSLLAVKSIPLPRDAFDVEQRLHVLEEAYTQAKTRLQQAEQAQRAKAQLTVQSAMLLLKPASTWSITPAVDLHHKQHEAARLELTAAQQQVALMELAVAQRKQPSKLDHFTTLQRSLQRQVHLLEARSQLAQAQASCWQSSPKKQAATRDAIQQAQLKVQQAEQALLQPIDDKPTAPKYPSSSTGRRTALAHWIADRHNPLTARVAVNHVWHRHFGQPLVNTMFDFGRNGQPPSHPALLDWLAVEFMDSGWSMKKLHKLIVTSAAYRLDSTPDSALLQADPDNRYYWRHAPTRMTAESVRDSMLALAGKLDLQQGGPELPYEQGLTTFRRSLYYRHANEKQMTFLVAFDAATPGECYRRDSSVAPQQALALFNSSLAQLASTTIEERLSKKAELHPSDFVQQAYQVILGRSATDEEVKLCLSFLDEQQKQSSNLKKARSSLILVLLNHHEFVTIR